MSKRQMLINYVPGEECRIAIVEDGRLEELYQERASSESHVGNIYKGKVLNVEPSIQAAFVDFGLERNGFLHISDLHPMYFPGEYREETEQVGLKTPRRDRPPIQKCLRRGQEVLVQVLKEGIGTKGPTLTSYLSIPGRYLVMMPNMERMGVSRKVDDDEARRAMRDILDSLNPPKGFGFIIRTAGIGRTKTDLKRDLAYLQRLWKTIDRRMQTTKVGELFAESDLVIRTIRDVYTSDIEKIIVDDPTAARRAMDFLSISNPRSGANVLVYRDPIPLFHRYDLERQIENINARTVPLTSGGSLVIDSTEALVAIDVNSGKSRDNRDAEMTAYKTNLEAADEICRQLRLRDLGGVIVNDLIDMRLPKHRREIEHRFRENLKNDRARTRTLPISQFGILEMTRQRMRPSLKKSIYTDCPSCHGQGSVKSPESVVLDVMRRLALVMHKTIVGRVELTVSPDVAFQLLNRKRSQLVGIEQAHGKPVLVRVNGAGPMDYVMLEAFDARGSAVEAERIEPLAEPQLEPVDTAVVEEDLAAEDFEEEETPSETTEQESQEFVAVQPEEEPLPGDDQAAVVTADLLAAEGEAPVLPAAAQGEGQEGGGRRRRRRRRGGRGRNRKEGQPGQPPSPAQPASEFRQENQPTLPATSGEFAESPAEEAAQPFEKPEPPGNRAEESHAETPAAEPAQGQPGSEGQPGGRKRRRRRRGGRGRRRDGQPNPNEGQPQNAQPSRGPSGGGGGGKGSSGQPHGGRQQHHHPAPSGQNLPKPVPPPRPAEALRTPPQAPSHPVVIPPPVTPAPAPRPSQSVSRGYRNARPRPNAEGQATPPPAAPGNPRP